MRTLVPPFILDQVEHNTPTGSIEAAVLLIDATGSTALASSLRVAGIQGAEILASITWEVFAPQVDAVLRHGGFVGGFTGDGFVALFPGNPAFAIPRALATARAIRKHMETCSIHRHEFGESHFDVKAAIAHGEVSWHIWHSPLVAHGQSHAYMLSGPAVRGAQIGEGLARSGSVILTESVSRYVPGDDVEPVTRDGFVELRQTAIEDTTDDTSAVVVPMRQGADRFFPSSLLTTPLRGEFRSVVSAFVSLRETPDARNANSTMSQLLQMVAAKGGYVCDIHPPPATDDGCTVLTYWGAPTAFEDTLERAVTFLLDVRDTLGADAMRAGATVDTLFAGFIGSENQSAYTCIGSGVNLAARLVSANDWGDIWLDDALASVLATEVRAQPVGRRTFRGFDDDTTVTALLGKGDVEIETFFAGTFVGRDRETEQLLQWLRDIRDGASGAIVVTGEAGAGKSRLLHQLQDRLGVDVRWMVGQTDPIGRAPMNPVAYMVRRGMDIHLEDAPSAMRDKVDARLSAMIEHSDPDPGSELAHAREPILALIGALAPESSFFNLSAQLRFERTVESLVAILAFDAQQRFVVAHLEDAQWLDATTLEVLARVVEAIAHLRIAIVISSRVTLEHPWVAHSLSLSPLDRDAIRSHSSSLLSSPVSEELVDLLVMRTDGNPYYTEQVVLFMQAEDLLVPTPGGLAPRSEGTPVPGNLQSVLIARIDRLTERVKIAVQHASVLGREFDLQILVRMLGDPGSGRDVAIAEANGIWTALSELRYLFRHALMRDAAYEMQLHADLRSLHATAANAIEFLAAGEPERHASSLAYHLERGGQSEQAAGWYRIAGIDAASQFANEDAITRFVRALELTRPDDRALRFDVLCSLEGVYRLIGETDLQRSAMEDLDRLSLDLGVDEQLMAMRVKTLYLTHVGAYAEATKEGTRALASADEVDKPVEQTLIRLALAQVARASGDNDRAEEIAHEASDIAERLGNISGAATTSDLLGGIAYDRGDYSKASEFHGRAATALADLGDQVGEIRALNNLGSALWGIGDFTEAARVHEVGVARSRAIGYRMSEGDNLDNLGGARWAVGDYSQAIVHYRAALFLRRRANDAWGVGISLSNLGNAYLAAGEPDLAVDHYVEGIETDRAPAGRGVLSAWIGLGVPGHCSAGIGDRGVLGRPPDPDRDRRGASCDGVTGRPGGSSHGQRTDARGNTTGRGGPW